MIQLFIYVQVKNTLLNGSVSYISLFEASIDVKWLIIKFYFWRWLPATKDLSYTASVLSFGLHRFFFTCVCVDCVKSLFRTNDGCLQIMNCSSMCIFFHEYRRICFDYIPPFSSPADPVCLHHIEIASPKQSRVFACSTTQTGEEKRSKGKTSRGPYRPFMLLVMTGNVRSSNNKIDELSSLSTFHSDYRQASIIILFN